MARYLITLIYILILGSCIKRTDVSGTVYSKHNIPVPNASIAYDKFGGSNYPVSSQWSVTTTDATGRYKFSFTTTASKNYYYKVKCFCDSGYNNSMIETGKSNHIDLYLH